MRRNTCDLTREFAGFGGESFFCCLIGNPQCLFLFLLLEDPANNRYQKYLTDPCDLVFFILLQENYYVHSLVSVFKKG